MDDLFLYQTVTKEVEHLDFLITDPYMNSLDKEIEEAKKRVLLGVKEVIGYIISERDEQLIKNLVLTLSGDSKGLSEKDSKQINSERIRRAISLVNKNFKRVLNKKLIDRIVSCKTIQEIELEERELLIRIKTVSKN